MSEESKPLDTDQAPENDPAIAQTDLGEDSMSLPDSVLDNAVSETSASETEDNLTDPTSNSDPSSSDSPDIAAEAEVDVEALNRLATEIESLHLQLEERTNQSMRIAADFDNFRKRTEREKTELNARVKRETITELLPVIDSFEMARTQLKPETEQEVNIHKSYQGVYKQLVDGLKRIGVSPMRAEGELFDPNFHDAVMREATNDYPEGTVIEELRRGYLLGEVILRHAMVKVATPAENTPSNESAEDAASPSNEEGADITG